MSIHRQFTAALAVLMLGLSGCGTPSSAPAPTASQRPLASATAPAVTDPTLPSDATASPAPVQVPSQTPSQPQATARPVRMVVILLENRSMADVQGNAYFASLVARGKLLSNYVTIANPSQPNYVALNFGDTMGVTSNDVTNIPGRNIVDLLEEAGMSWKTYQEDYPGDCNTAERAGGDTGRTYARKHNAFISADTVRLDPARCARIVDHHAFEADAAAGALPRYSVFVPNAYHSSHDTNVDVAAEWMQAWLEPKLVNPALSDVLWVITWDEGTVNGSEQLLTILLGRGVAAGTVDDRPYNHYALLRTTQVLLGLGSLGRNDTNAPVIPVFSDGG